MFSTLCFAVQLTKDGDVRVLTCSARGVRQPMPLAMQCFCVQLAGMGLAVQVRDKKDAMAV